MQECRCRGGNKDCWMCGGLGAVMPKPPSPPRLAPCAPPSSSPGGVCRRYPAEGYLAMSEAGWLAFLAAHSKEMKTRGRETKARPKAQCPECGKICRGAVGVEAHRANKHPLMATPAPAPPGRR